MLKDGKYLAIVSRVDVRNEQPSNLTVFRLHMLVTQGEDRGQSLLIKYFYRDILPEKMKKELLCLGFNVFGIEDVEDVVHELSGKIALVSLKSEHGRQSGYIERYMGSDNPAKFIAKNEE